MTAIAAPASCSRVPSFDVSIERFLNYLRTHADQLFPELNSQTISVRTVQSVIRRHTSLIEFDVSDGKRTKPVICKIASTLPKGRNTEFAVEARPRLFPPFDPASSGLREFRALKSIESHFSALQDNRFGVITVLGLIDNPFVIIMDKCQDVSLKSLLKKSTRFHYRRNSCSVNHALLNAGAWLREVHRMPELPHTKTRHSERSGYGDAVQLFTDALVQKLGNQPFFHGIRHKLDAIATKSLPCQLPCATAHGDFAPRNILVGENSRVTILDTQRRWRSPVYEDLAYLLMSLKLPALQVRTLGALFSPRQLAEWESEFLRGYFGSESTSIAAIRLYEVLLTMEWWAAINFRNTSNGLINRLGLGLGNRYLFRHIGGLMNQLEQL